MTRGSPRAGERRHFFFPDSTNQLEIYAVTAVRVGPRSSYLQVLPGEPLRSSRRRKELKFIRILQAKERNELFQRGLQATELGCVSRPEVQSFRKRSIHQPNLARAQTLFQMHVSRLHHAPWKIRLALLLKLV